jgi:3-oxoacyl-[acyl-carrier-protein] synthase-1
MLTAPVCLTATTLALICPVGLAPASAAAAMRAGLSGFTEVSYTYDNGQPIVAAVVPTLSNTLHGRSRLIELLVTAFDGIDSRVPEDIKLDDVPLYLCTRELERPGPKVNGVVSEVEARLNCIFRRDSSAHFARGSVAAFEALQLARLTLAARRSEACLIAAVDTHIDARVLRWLHRAKRLKTSTQSDGVIPGEAACVMLVTSRPRTPSHLKIHGLGFATESATILNEEPLLGTGMAAAAKNALNEAGVAMDRVDFRLSDAAGESYAFEELALAQTRLLRQRRESQALWHPAASVGDCGAVAGLIQLAWAEQAFVRGYAPGPMALAHCSTPAGARAVALVGC